MVLDAAWPAFFGLGAFAALLLSFILWRLTVIIIRYRSRKSEQRNVSKAYPAYVADGPDISVKPRHRGCVSALSLSAFRWIAGILFLGILAGCIYGLIESNPQLVPQGIDQVDAVKSYIQHVLNVGGVTISEAEAIDSALVDVQSVINQDVNVTDVTANLECMRPWINQLPNPASLRTSVLNVSQLVGNLTPLLNTTSRDMVDLISLLETLLSSEPQLQNIVLQEQTFASAASALTIPTETAGTVNTAVTALSTLLGQYATNIGAMDTLIAALQGAATVLIGTDTSLSQSITAATELISGPAAALNGTLNAQTTAYQAVRPCITSLLERSQVINTSVVQLPQSLNSNLQQINNTRSTLDAILFRPISQINSALSNVSAINSSVETAAEFLNSTIVAATQQLALSQSFKTSLSAAEQTFAQLPISTLVSQLNATRNAMVEAQGGT